MTQGLIFIGMRLQTGIYVSVDFRLIVITTTHAQNVAWLYNGYNYLYLNVYKDEVKTDHSSLSLLNFFFFYWRW